MKMSSSSVGRVLCNRVAGIGKLSPAVVSHHSAPQQQQRQIRPIHSTNLSNTAILTTSNAANRFICAQSRQPLGGVSPLANLSAAASREKTRLAPRKMVVEDFAAEGKHFCVELMNQYDSDLASRFGFKHIRIAEPLTVALNCSPDDVEILYFDQCKRSIESGTSLIVFDKHKLSDPRPEPESPDAIILISTQELSEKNRPPPKEFRFKEDYGDNVEMGGYLRRNANRVHVLSNELLSQFPFFVPVNTKKIGIVESYCVHPDYYGIGLTEKIFQEAMKLAKANGVEYLAAICLASDFRRICHELKFRPYMDFPLINFKDRDNVVFKPIHNDPASSKVTLMIAKL